MSYKPEVQTAGDGDSWSSNAARFATAQEAQDYVYNLMFRWTAVSNTRVSESPDAVNATWGASGVTFLK